MEAQVYPAVVVASPLRGHGSSGPVPGELLQYVDDTGSAVATHSQEEFLTIVGIVLASQQVRTMIQSLIAKSNEVKHPPTVPVEVLDQPPAPQQDQPI